MTFAPPLQRGNTVLHIACREGLTELVKLLCAKGANVTMPNNTRVSEFIVYLSTFPSTIVTCTTTIMVHWLYDMTHTHTHYITYRSTRLPCTMPATGAVWSWWPLSSAGTPHASTWMHRTVIKTLLCTLPVAVDTRPSSSYSCPEGQLKEPRTRYFSTTFQN